WLRLFWRQLRLTFCTSRWPQSYQSSMSALPPKADICGALAHVRFGPKADINRSARPAPKCARLLLQIFSFVRYGVKELRDLLVHELNVGSFRRRYGEVALKRWDHDVLRARNMSRVVRGFRRRIVKIARSIHENCFCLDALECLDGVAIKSRRR